VTNSSASPDTAAAVGTEPSAASTAPYPGTPRWVIVSGIVVLALVLLFVGLHLAGGGMGPMNHLSSMSGH
jgi:hypothetical protein